MQQVFVISEAFGVLSGCDCAGIEFVKGQVGERIDFQAGIEVLHGVGLGAQDGKTRPRNHDSELHRR